jgi:hypothetical protein
MVPGILSGSIICLVTYGGVAYGRKGTRYVSAVTPPLAYAATTMVYVLLSDGLHPSRIGIDFHRISCQRSAVLLISALYGWYMFLNEKAKSRPSRRLEPSA